jgi:hypothetical protein
MQQLERDKNAKRDLVIGSEKLRFQIIGKELLMRIDTGKVPLLVPVSSRAHTQLAQWMHLPMRCGFYQMMIGGAFTAADRRDFEDTQRRRNWDMFCNVANEFFQTRQDKRLIRLLPNNDGDLYCRAILSNSYQIIDSSDFFFTIATRAKEVGADIWNARLSEDKFYGYAVHPSVAETIELQREKDGPNAHVFRQFGREGKDMIRPAMVFSNSETGEGGCTMERALCWDYCTNYAVTMKVLNKVHIGRKQGDEEFLRPETLKKENEVFFMKAADIVEGCLSKEHFDGYVDKLRGAHEEDVEDPVAAAEALAICYDIPEKDKDAIRNLFLEKCPKTRYGLIGAVTEYAHNDDLNADVGYSLEELGAKLIDTPVATIEKRAERLKKEKSKEKAVEAAGVGV